MPRPALALIAILASTSGSNAEQRAVDVSTSTLTVHVYKSGLFSAFADNHVVRAPIARGVFDTSAVELLVRASELTVIDPGQSAGTRGEIQQRMLGPEVLDSARFPDIRFRSTMVEPAGTGRWRVTGELRFHGHVQPLVVTVVERDGHYLGNFALKQRDFGIEPISIAGGTVKVKDELKIEFDIVPVHETARASPESSATCAGVAAPRAPGRVRAAPAFCDPFGKSWKVD